MQQKGCEIGDFDIPEERQNWREVGDLYLAREEGERSDWVDFMQRSDGGKERLF